jgi:cell division protein ZapA (FtsZ GTPase activity inhibitor)
MIELEVEIYGKKYVLRGSSPEEVRAVAKYMDQRMRELFGADAKGLDGPKLFALAMNFAEELCNLKKEGESREAEFGKKLDQFLARMAQLEKILEV